MSFILRIVAEPGGVIMKLWLMQKVTYFTGSDRGGCENDTGHHCNEPPLPVSAWLKGR